MQKKALVVDNDFFFVEFLSDLLVKRGYHVLKAYNGKEGIAKLADDTVDILFADLILPKVDGRQFFKFIRDKYRNQHFPIVALSGSMIEQLESLRDIGADYFIAKGPINQLTIKLNEFMAAVEAQPPLPPSENGIVATGNLYPRRDAVVLMDSLHFHQAVIESAAIGIVIVDEDTRIINANPAALDIIAADSIDVINRPVAELFGTEERAEFIAGLKLVKRQGELKKYSFCATLDSQLVATSVSAITLKGAPVGWVVVLDSAWQDDSQPSLN